MNTKPTAPKNPAPLPPLSAREDDEDILAQRLAALALATVGEHSEELQQLVRRCLHKKYDDALYEALEQLREDHAEAALALRELVEEQAGIVISKRGERSFETNAFAIPVLLRSRGGLLQEQTFLDQPAFEKLRDSMVEMKLESRKAHIALIPHAYHPDEAAAISYCELQAMTHDAAASLVDEKMAPAPAIERSMRGWPQRGFGAADEALELRFLLGFACKPLDDPFYIPPADEAKADAWYEERMERFRAWSEAAAPLLRSCLATDGRVTEANFLYQDLFFGARTAGLREYGLIELLQALDAALQEHGVAAQHATAELAEDDDEEGLLLTVTLHAGGKELAHAGLPRNEALALEDDLQDLAQALAGLGLGQILRVE